MRVIYLLRVLSTYQHSESNSKKHKSDTDPQFCVNIYSFNENLFHYPVKYTLTFSFDYPVNKSATPLNLFRHAKEIFLQTERKQR
jgi:hypothetical protein